MKKQKKQQPKKQTDTKKKLDIGIKSENEIRRGRRPIDPHSAD